MTNFKVNQRVERVQPGDYTNGRIGNIIEIDEVKRRARVNWNAERTRDQIQWTNGIKTWVSFDRLVDFSHDVSATIKYLKAEQQSYRVKANNPRRYSQGMINEMKRLADEYGKLIESLVL